jgi:hypothetical protein
MARRLGATVIDLDMALPFTAARARNAGLKALMASHPDVVYVHFVDGDCEFEAGWIDLALRFLESRPDVAVACGRRRERYLDTFYNRLCDAEWNTPVGEARSCGGDALMRVVAVRSIDGYDSTLAAGEEPELCHRLRRVGWRIWRLDAPMTIHDAAMKHFRQWWIRSVRSGLGYAQGWRATWNDPRPLYRVETVRALAWTFGVAGGAVLGGSIIHGWLFFLAPLVWSLQLARLACRYGLAKGALLLMGKFAEAVGVVKFIARTLGGRPGGTLFYK